MPSAARGLPIAPSLPRLLPSPPNHPTIYLPVPDPASLRLLIHYMYFGSTAYIEEALDEGTVTWEGLARNVEFLGMGMEIKVCLGRWYGRWRRGRSEQGHVTFSTTYDYIALWAPGDAFGGAPGAGDVLTSALDAGIVSSRLALSSKSQSTDTHILGRSRSRCLCSATAPISTRTPAGLPLPLLRIALSPCSSGPSSRGSSASRLASRSRSPADSCRRRWLSSWSR